MGGVSDNDGTVDDGTVKLIETLKTSIYNTKHTQAPNYICELPLLLFSPNIYVPKLYHFYILSPNVVIE